MLKTKSIYKPKEYGDGTRILICRLCPRGTKKEKIDQWYKDLAPSKELIKKYKGNEITVRKFLSSYKSEISRNPSSLELIKKIRKYSKRENVTLLCFEPDGEPCHRHVLREIMKNEKFFHSSAMPEFTDSHLTKINSV
ncbi:MAG: DUF488 domain-containing protein [Nitrosopumilus sp.]